MRLAYNRAVFLSILTTRSMSLMRLTIEFKYGSTRVLIHQKQFPAVCQVRTLFSWQLMEIFMLTMVYIMVEWTNGQWMQTLVFRPCLLIHHVMVSLLISMIPFIAQCLIFIKLSKDGWLIIRPHRHLLPVQVSWDPPQICLINLLVSLLMSTLIYMWQILEIVEFNSLE